MPLSAEEKADLIARYKAGEPWRDLEDRFGQSMAWLLKTVIRAAGIPRRSSYGTQWEQQGGLGCPWLGQRDKLIELLLDGRTNEEIASILDRTRDGVRHECKRLGFASPTEIDTAVANTLFQSGWEPEAILKTINPFYGKWLRVAQADRAELRRREQRRFEGNRRVFANLTRRFSAVGRDLQKQARAEHRRISASRRALDKLSKRLALAGERAKRDLSRRELFLQLDDLGLSNIVIAEGLGVSRFHVPKIRRQLDLPARRRYKCAKCGTRFVSLRRDVRWCSTCRHSSDIYRTVGQRILAQAGNEW
jgi:hypothetical protein